jgi:hypothetical protein
MAKVIDQSYEYSEVCPAISAYLTANWDWGAIDTGIELEYSGVTGIYTVFYADIEKTIGIAVGENTTTTNTYAVGIVLNGVLDYWRLTALTTTSLHIVQNNTALYIGEYSGEVGEPTEVPIGFYVCNAIAQDGSKKITPIIGSFSYTSDIYTEYRIYAPEADAPIIKTYQLVTEAPYNVFIPLIGSDVGVAAGIYYTLMNEYTAMDIRAVHMNGKTFYICGNAALIDTYTG